MKKYKGKTLEETLEKAADAENIDIEYLQYSIIKEEEKEVEIQVYFVSDVVSYVKEYLNTFFKNLELESFDVEGQQEKEVISIRVSTSNDAVLIGKRGNTLQSLNTLLRSLIIKKYGKHHKILLDIGDYKQKKYEELIKMARMKAKEVRQTKVKLSLYPMPSDERRIVHNALSEYKDIKTESEGFGRDRKLVISYKEE